MTTEYTRQRKSYPDETHAAFIERRLKAYEAECARARQKERIKAILIFGACAALVQALLTAYFLYA